MAKRREARGLSDIVKVDAFAASALACLSISLLCAKPAHADDLDPPSSDLSMASERWAEFRAADDGSDVESAAFTGFRTAALELGAVELRDHAAVLFLEARQAAASSNAGRASTLRNWAETLDPSEIAAIRESAAELTERAPWRLDRVFGTVVRAIGHTLTTSVGRALLASATAALAALAALVATVAFAIAVFARTNVLAAADLHRPVRSFATQWQTRMLVAALVAFPALYFWAPPLAVASAIAGASLHVGWRDRLVGIALLACVALVPAALETSLSAARAARAADDIRPAVVGVCDVSCVERLEFSEARGSSDARLALAWWAWRAGQPESRAHAAELLDRVEAGNGRDASIATLRGNLALAAGQRDVAQRSYVEAREAAVTDEQRAAASFNLHRVHMLANDSAAARVALRDATAADAHLVNTFVEYDGRAQNRVVVASTFDPGVSFERAGLFPAELSPSVAATLDASGPWPGATGGLSGMAMALAGLLVVGWPLGRVFGVSKPCRRCGTATSARIHPASAIAGVCVACHQLSTDQRLSYTQRTARERRIETTHTLRMGAALLAGIALPGSSTLARGASLRGGLLMVVGGVGFVMWSGVFGPWATVLAPLGDADPALSHLAGMWFHGLAAFATIVDAAIHYRRRR